MPQCQESINEERTSDYFPEFRQAPKPLEPDQFPFASAFLNHAHINGQTIDLKRVGGTLRYVYDPDPARVEAFLRRHPEAQAVDDFQRILDDPEILLVNAAAIPCERGQVGCQVMRAGKDYFTDKCPFTTMRQLEEAREIADETGRRYWVNYGELISSEAVWHAGELVRQGAIGEVLHVSASGPHRLNASTRPDWFFKKAFYGGILTDIACHQIAQFIHYTGANTGEVLHARVRNFANPSYPELEDFGEASFQMGSRALCYSRVDWLTPDGLSTWGDGRTFIIGTKGSIEVRKNLDVSRGKGGILFLVTEKEELEIPCSGKVYLPFYDRMLRDVLEGTDTAMNQHAVFLAAELSLRAQALADQR